MVAIFFYIFLWMIATWATLKKFIKKIALGLWFETWEAYDIITLGIDIVDCIILLTPW
jgi:hypothetical protein